MFSNSTFSVASYKHQPTPFKLCFQGDAGHVTFIKGTDFRFKPWKIWNNIKAR